MRHLDEESLVDALDGLGSTEAMAHLERCADCRRQVEDLRVALSSVSEVDAPEPSPLFWQHFDSRVAAAIEVPDSRPSWRIGGAFGWLTAGSMGATIALLLLTFPAVRQPAGEITTPPETTVAAFEAGDVDDLDADEAWALVRDVADELDYDTVREIGVTAAPGSLDRAASELSPAEQNALIQLIQEELKRTDS